MYAVVFLILFTILDYMVTWSHIILIQFNSIKYFIFPIIKYKEYNIHVMSCAPVKEEFNYSSECFTMRRDSQKAELISLVSEG